jgi:hypothetical protein
LYITPTDIQLQYSTLNEIHKSNNIKQPPKAHSSTQEFGEEGATIMGGTTSTVVLLFGTEYIYCFDD